MCGEYRIRQAVFVAKNIFLDNVFHFILYMIRLFTAIQIPASIKRQLLGLVWPIKGARWQSFEQLHITTNFIGDVDNSLLPAIKKVLNAVNLEAFELALSGVDYFGSKRQPRVLYVEVKSSPGLLQLHKIIDNALLETGIEIENRKFKPHVTLARLKHTSFHAVGEFLESESLFKTEKFLVDEFHLFSSRLSHEGSRYFIEASYPLERSSSI